MFVRPHKPILRNNPAGIVKSLAPAAWYDAAKGITTATGVSNWADQSGNGRDLVQASGSNQPIYLASAASYGVSKYAWLSGVSGNQFTTPNAAANQITGDIDIRMWIASDDWTPGSNYCLLSKDGGGGTRGFAFFLDSTGKIRLFWSNDGTAVSGNTASSVAPTVSDGAPLWVRVTLDVDNGASGNDVKYYTSTDGSTWIQLGTTVTGGSTTSINVANQPVSILAEPIWGIYSGPVKVFRAQIYNGINGTLAVDFDPSTFSETGTNGATAVASTGETWTLNSTGSKPAQVVRDASLLFDGTNHVLKTGAFTLNQPSTIYVVVEVVAWAFQARIFDGNALNTMGALFDNGGVGISPNIQMYAGNYGPVDLTHLTVGSSHVLSCTFNGASSNLTVDNNTSATGNVGPINAGAITLGASTAALANPANVQIKEFIAFPAAHDASQRARVVRYLNQKYQVF